MHYRKTQRYARLLANGEWQHFSLPAFMDVYDVLRHCHYATIALFVPRGQRVTVYLGEGLGSEFEKGPTWVLWDKERQDWVRGGADLEKISHRQAYQYA